MTVTLEELTTPMTVEEAKTAIYAALAARGVKTTAWKAGAVTRTVIHGLAIVASALSELQALLAKQGFLDLAEGDWLTLLARYVYDVTRIEGTFAETTVTLTNSAGGVFSGGTGDLVVSSSVNGKAYRSTEPYSLAAMGTTDVEVQAIEIGEDSSANAGEIDTLVTVLTGVTVTNATAAVGSDIETDAALRIRCRDRLGALSPNGPSDAYRYFATSAIDSVGDPIGVTRVATTTTGDGTVTCFVATDSGGVTGDVDDPDTDLGAIFVALDENVVPLGVELDLQSATPVTVAVTYEIWVRDAIAPSSTDVQDLIEDAIAVFLGDHPIGGEVISPAAGKLYVDSLEAAIANALPLGAIVKITTTVPAADVDLDPNEVAVAGTITCTAVTRVGGIT